jgi:hypothetical protein
VGTTIINPATLKSLTQHMSFISQSTMCRLSIFLKEAGSELGFDSTVGFFAPN